MAEEEKELLGTPDNDAAKKAAEAASARLAENPWAGNPEATRIEGEQETENPSC